MQTLLKLPIRPVCVIITPATTMIGSLLDRPDSSRKTRRTRLSPHKGDRTDRPPITAHPLHSLGGWVWEVIHCLRKGVADDAAIAVPLRPAVGGQGTLCFLSTTTVFGTPVDITLSELFVGAFLPANAATADALRSLAAGQDARPLPS